MVEAFCTLNNLCELYMDRFVPEWSGGHDEDAEHLPCNVGDVHSDV